MAENAEISFPV